MITQSKLKELFNYIDGELYWKVRPYKSHVDISNPAGSITTRGYRTIMINKKHHCAHRLVYMLHQGHFPKTLDHINNDRTDNRIENLRPATRSQNNRNAMIGRNNTSGVKGVSFCKKSNKWRAQIRNGGNNIAVGRFITIDDAEKAMTKKRLELHGEYANNG